MHVLLRHLPVHASAAVIGLGNLLLGCGSSSEEDPVFKICPAGTTYLNGDCADVTGIGVNTVGYLPDRIKRASIPASATSFQVHRTSDDSIALEGAVFGPIPNSDTEQEVWIADFTELTEEGEFYLSVDAAGLDPSPPFRIGAQVYNELLDVLMLGMYGQRCGTAVEFTWKEQRFQHDACHLQDARLDFVGGAGTNRDGTGGWHDAGDYGKYTVNAGFSHGMMLLAWEQFSNQLVSRAFNFIPELDNGIPDYLDENRYDLEWLLKMQNADGSVSHKITPVDFEGFMMPSADTSARYFSDWGTASTAAFVGATARAARAFADFDPDFSARCRAAAEKSFDFMMAQPTEKSPNLSDFVNQQYVSGSLDDVCWARCEISETTGRDDALEACEASLGNAKLKDNWDWSDVSNLCFFTYALSKREDREPTLVETVRSTIIASADRLATNAEQGAYGLGYSGVRYWGINGIYARTALNLGVAYALQPDERYLDAATQQIDHVLGRNYYGRSQVTGIGHAPPVGPHHRPSVADGAGAPWPGLLVGGSSLSGEQQGRENPPPSGTAWDDSINSAQTNEIAINWNAALIYAVAGFTK